nr:Dynein assembly factor 4, axonemal [Polyrhizophydium stewartii]
MPIVVKEFEATQTDQSVFVTVPLRGASSAKTDVYCNDVYIKVSFPPYFFELDLAHAIDPHASVATVRPDAVTFELVKAVPGEWSEIRFTGESPKALRDRRREAEERYRVQMEERRKARTVEKREQERDLVRRQIDVEREKRERVEAIKRAELEAGRGDVLSWAQATLQRERERAREARIVECVEDADGGGDGDGSEHGVGGGRASADKKHQSEIQTERTDSAIFADDDAVQDTRDTDDLDKAADDDDDEACDDDIDVETIRARVRAQLKVRVRPAPRQSQDITVSFTRRGLIPTSTARESEDEKWRIRIKLAQEVQKAQGKQGVSYTKAVFLRDKAVEFFKQGSTESALNAFSAAIELDLVNAELFVNRAACHLKLGDAASCIADCTTSLSLVAKEEELIKEQSGAVSEVESEPINDLAGSATPRVLTGAALRRQTRAKALSRRGAAKATLLNDLRGAAIDFRDALAQDPLNQGLRRDAEELCERLGLDINDPECFK